MVFPVMVFWVIVTLLEEATLTYIPPPGPPRNSAPLVMVNPSIVRSNISPKLERTKKTLALLFPSIVVLAGFNVREVKVLSHPPSMVKVKFPVVDGLMVKFSMYVPWATRITSVSPTGVEAARAASMAD